MGSAAGAFPNTNILTISTCRNIYRQSDPSKCLGCRRLQVAEEDRAADETAAAEGWALAVSRNKHI
jgi:hypothetical protein